MLIIPFPFKIPYAKQIIKFKGIEDLKCTIFDIAESQRYGLPQNPLDNGSYVGDTVYKLPKQINMRVLVDNNDLLEFKDNIEECQFSGQMFTVVNLAGEIFNNLKISFFNKETTAKVVDKTFFIINLEEVILVSALVEPYDVSKNPAYGDDKKAGQKDAKKVSALKQFQNNFF